MSTLSGEVQDEVKQKVLETGLLYINKNAEKLVVQIHYFEYYSESPYKHYDKNGQPIEETGDDYDSARMTSFKEFMKSLDPIRETRSGLKKGDDNYWNHCIAIIEKKGNSVFRFDYSEELEKAEESRLRESLGDELYEKCEQERKNFKENPEPEMPSQTASDPMDMSISELTGEMYKALVKDLPAQWHSFQVEGEVFEEKGKNVISTYFHYKSDADSSLQKINPSNIILQGNIVLYINKKMTADGRGWRKALFMFEKDNSCNIEVLEK